ncbi:MAG TPA: hypothetical protein VFF65_00105, partial [Phycisphaerales bacterium]|nr:hypothetical protein [Phycisphaerales bacterium]
DLRDTAGNYLSDRVLELTAFDPKTGAHPVQVEREAPSLFTASVPQGEFGSSRQLAWRITSGPGADAIVTVPFGFVEPFSPEFLTLGPDAELVHLSKSEGVPVASVGAVDLNLPPRTGVERTILWPWFLAAALLLAPLDILCRRLG